jgi:hypothetical protein
MRSLYCCITHIAANNMKNTCSFMQSVPHFCPNLTNCMQFHMNSPLVLIGSYTVKLKMKAKYPFSQQARTDYSTCAKYAILILTESVPYMINLTFFQIYLSKRTNNIKLNFLQQYIIRHLCRNGN